MESRCWGKHWSWGTLAGSEGRTVSLVYNFIVDPIINPSGAETGTFLDSYVNTTAVDALALCMAGSSAGTVLTMQCRRALVLPPRGNHSATRVIPMTRICYEKMYAMRKVYLYIGNQLSVKKTKSFSCLLSQNSLNFLEKKSLESEMLGKFLFQLFPENSPLSIISWEIL